VGISSIRDDQETHHATMSGTHQAQAERPAWVPRDLYPFESRFADIGGSRVHYVDEGDGPPLLLLHGNPTWSFV